MTHLSLGGPTGCPKEWCGQKFKRLMQTQLVEDSFNRMKLASRMQLNRTGREVVHYKNLATSPVLDIFPFSTHSLEPAPSRPW